MQNLTYFRDEMSMHFSQRLNEALIVSVCMFNSDFRKLIFTFQALKN